MRRVSEPAGNRVSVLGGTPPFGEKAGGTRDQRRDCLPQDRVALDRVGLDWVVLMSGAYRHDRTVTSGRGRRRHNCADLTVSFCWPADMKRTKKR